jgi:hypothetical protein
MLPRMKRVAAVWTITAGAAACGPVLAPGASGFSEGNRLQAGERNTTGVVITGAQLRSGGTSLLDGLRARISNLRVEVNQQCPEIRLRGQRSISGNSNPIVYVNGARTANTCVLEQIQPVDVETVEVYASGVSNRPGIRNSPTGLVLVYTRDGR